MSRRGIIYRITDRGCMKRQFITTLALVALLVFGAVSCSQWKVSALKSKKICTLYGGTNPGNVLIDYNDNGVLNLSFLVRVFDGKIYTVDNALKRVQVFQHDGTPELIIGQKPANKEDAEKIRYTSFNFSFLGALAVDSSGNIYVQNRLMPSGAGVSAKSDEMGFSPSYILVFNKNGELQTTLGQRGVPDMPFYYIESIEIDRHDRMFVLSRSFDTWSVYRFSGRKRDFYANLSAIDFKESEGKDTYTGRIENVKVFGSGESFLVSVAYYHGSRFKYRKIYEYSLQEGRIVKTVLEIPDPKNEFFTMVNDKHIYLWNVENKKIKFVIMNFDGNIISNIMITMRDNMCFEDIFVDESGQLYSTHVGRKDIGVMEWK